MAASSPHSTHYGDDFSRQRALCMLLDAHPLRFGGRSGYGPALIFMAPDPNVFLRRSWETASRRGCYGPGFVTVQGEGDSDAPVPRVRDTKHSTVRDRAEEKLTRGPT